MTLATIIVAVSTSMLVTGIYDEICWTGIYGPLIFRSGRSTFSIFLLAHVLIGPRIPDADLVITQMSCSIRTVRIDVLY